MTAVETPPDEIDVVDDFVGTTITTKRKRELGDDDRLKFKIDDDVYTLRRPKLSVAMGMSQLAEATNAETYKIGVGLVQFFTAFIRYVEVEAPDPTTGRPNGRGLLLQRLDDPDDDLDLLDLGPLFKDLSEALFGGNPTGGSPASTPKRSKGGRASGAGSRGKRA